MLLCEMKRKKPGIFETPEKYLQKKVRELPKFTKKSSRFFFPNMIDVHGVFSESRHNGARHKPAVEWVAIEHAYILP